MNVGIHKLPTKAPNLQVLWSVEKMKIDTAHQGIGVNLALPDVQIVYDRLPVIGLAGQAVDGVRQRDVKNWPQAAKRAFLG